MGYASRAIFHLLNLKMDRLLDKTLSRLSSHLYEILRAVLETDRSLCQWVHLAFEAKLQALKLSLLYEDLRYNRLVSDDFLKRFWCVIVPFCEASF